MWTLTLGMINVNNMLQKSKLGFVIPMDMCGYVVPIVKIAHEFFSGVAQHVRSKSVYISNIGKTETIHTSLKYVHGFTNQYPVATYKNPRQVKVRETQRVSMLLRPR